MDVVIPLGSSAASNHIELRYCLRSIEKYVPDLGNVFIVGDKPSWLRSAFHLLETDQKEKSAKERNIFRKLMKAVSSPLVSDDFLYCNDDHFLLCPWEEHYHHKGPLADSVKALSDSSLYRRTLANTLAFLGGGDNYDTHCPITFNKYKFITSVGCAPWFNPYGYAIKSLYCSLNEIDGEFYSDMKFTMPMTIESHQRALFRPYFSTDDKAINKDMVDFLETLYPNKSVYEKD